jgi:hypothetical protein
MDAVTWVHDEMLDTQWLREGQPAIFVFDEQWLREERVALNRIVFMYECLLEMPPVEIVKGDVVREVARFAARHGAGRVETLDSPLPRIKRQGAELGATWIVPEPLVELPPDVDLRRFSRYWNRAQKRLLRDFA